MKEHYDIDGKKLEKNHIYESKRSGELYCFLGNYSKYGEAQFESINRERVDIGEESSSLFKKLSRREIEKKIKWLEKGLED